MGQYYTPIIMNEKGTSKKAYYSHDYGNGLKIMEHSFLGNYFVETVLLELLNKPSRLAWVGDYAEVEEDDCINPNLTKELKEKFVKYEKNENKRYRKPLYDIQEGYEPNGYIINHTKHCYIDLQEYKKFAKKDISTWGNETWETQIHPLPLLTAIGNGKGGGDYWNEEQDNGYKVGLSSWAGDIIEYKYIFDNKDNYKNSSCDYDFYEKGYVK